jgi:hypothetical protein
MIKWTISTLARLFVLYLIKMSAAFELYLTGPVTRKRPKGESATRSSGPAPGRPAPGRRSGGSSDAWRAPPRAPGPTAGTTAATQALEQDQRRVRRPPDRRGVDLAKQPLERRPVDQRRDLLQLPVAQHPRPDSPPEKAAQAPAASTPPATAAYLTESQNRGYAKLSSTSTAASPRNGVAIYRAHAAVVGQRLPVLQPVRGAAAPASGSQWYSSWRGRW